MLKEKQHIVTLVKPSLSTRTNLSRRLQKTKSFDKSLYYQGCPKPHLFTIIPFKLAP